MLFLSKIGSMMLLALSFTVAKGQKNLTKSETVKIYGSCEMCKARIETAGKYKKASMVVWDQKAQTAVLSYNPEQTDKNTILKRIALAGYDNEAFLAPDDAYAKLPECCKYRSQSGTGHTPAPADAHAGHGAAVAQNQAPKHELQPVFDAYFRLKDALVQGNGKEASAAAAAMLSAINAVKMGNLQPAEHDVWMKVMSDLATHAGHISETQDIAHQRDHFMALSKSLYEPAKVSKPETPVYYQFCPMADGGKGANWLSKENTIRNPYFGAQMLSCGKTVETIQ